jgi:hypothetical protein
MLERKALVTNRLLPPSKPIKNPPVAGKSV